MYSYIQLATANISQPYVSELMTTPWVMVSMAYAQLAVGCRLVECEECGRSA